MYTVKRLLPSKRRETERDWLDQAAPTDQCHHSAISHDIGWIASIIPCYYLGLKGVVSSGVSVTVSRAPVTINIQSLSRWWFEPLVMFYVGALKHLHSQEHCARLFLQVSFPELSHEKLGALFAAMISLFLVLFLNIWTSPGAAVAIHLPRQGMCYVSFIRLFNTEDLFTLGGPKTVYSGRYRIYNCGDQASEVINTLQTLWQVLLPALEDANSRTSSDAYNAFFKQVYDAPTVAAVISNITTGAAVIGAHSSRNLLASPIIACANDPSKDPNKNGLLPSKSSRVRALALGYNNCATGQSACRLIGTPMIFLCEDFFAKVFLPSPGQCMSQGHGATNRYTELGGTFTDTQVRCRSYVPWIGVTASLWLICQTGLIPTGRDLVTRNRTLLCRFRFSHPRNHTTPSGTLPSEWLPASGYRNSAHESE